MNRLFRSTANSTDREDRLFLALDVLAGVAGCVVRVGELHLAEEAGGTGVHQWQL
jgi:hypothetical protein